MQYGPTLWIKTMSNQTKKTNEGGAANAADKNEEIKRKSDGYVRLCNYCKKPYTAVRPQSKYCKPIHRVAAFRLREKAAKNGS